MQSLLNQEESCDPSPSKSNVASPAKGTDHPNTAVVESVSFSMMYVCSRE